MSVGMVDGKDPNENAPLLANNHARRRSLFPSINDNADAESIASHVSKEEQLLADTSVGERLPYNDYTTIDWLHDLVRPEDILVF